MLFGQIPRQKLIEIIRPLTAVLRTCLEISKRLFLGSILFLSGNLPYSFLVLTEVATEISRNWGKLEVFSFFSELRGKSLFLGQKRELICEHAEHGQ